MSIYINKDTKVITQGITGKTGQFHTEKCQEYANGKNAFVAGVNPKKAGESIFNIPIYASVKEAAAQTGATVSVIYVPPPGAAAAIWEAVDADLDMAICITEGIPVRDMLEVALVRQPQPLPEEDVKVEAKPEAAGAAPASPASNDLLKH